MYQGLYAHKKYTLPYLLFFPSFIIILSYSFLKNLFPATEEVFLSLFYLLTMNDISLSSYQSQQEFALLSTLAYLHSQRYISLNHLDNGNQKTL